MRLKANVAFHHFGRFDQWSLIWVVLRHLGQRLDILNVISFRSFSRFGRVRVSGHCDWSISIRAMSQWPHVISDALSSELHDWGRSSERRLICHWLLHRMPPRLARISACCNFTEGMFRLHHGLSVNVHHYFRNWMAYRQCAPDIVRLEETFWWYMGFRSSDFVKCIFIILWRKYLFLALRLFCI